MNLCHNTNGEKMFVIRIEGQHKNLTNENFKKIIIKFKIKS